jgi:hypothetical protein
MSHDDQAGAHPEPKFQIQIDRTHFTVTSQQMTGEQLRHLPTPPIGPDRDLFEVVPGGSDKKIEDNDVVEIRNGMRFFTAPAQINPGELSACRSIVMLPTDDTAYLAERAVNHSVTAEANMTCVVIRNFALPTGLDRSQSDLLLRFNAGYPDVAPDMWWFDPPVRRADGQAIPATDVVERHLDRSWQRWSRHFTDGQWRSGIDGLESFLALIRRELERSTPGVAR